MESPLEVLSRAATMVQDKATSESKLPNKELPTTKWRRDRRRLSEYQTNPSSTNNNNNNNSSSNNNNNNNNTMPTQVSIKSRSPPPYREPLPGSTFALTLLRPTVITVGPKVVAKDEGALSVSPVVTPTISSKPPPSFSPSPSSSSTSSRSSGMVSPNGVPPGNRVKTLPQPQSGSSHNGTTTTSNGSSNKQNDQVAESISMCDTVIDEHFRRSLGNNYMQLFDKTGNGAAAAAVAVKGSLSTATPAVPLGTKSSRRVVKSTPPPPPVVKEVKKPPEDLVEEDNEDIVDKEDDGVDFSVDDHFAKALGETWNKLKANNNQRQEVRGTSSEEEEEESWSDEDDQEEDEEEDEDRNSMHKKRPRTERRGD